MTEMLTPSARKLRKIRAHLGPAKDWEEQQAALQMWCSSALVAGEKVQNELELKGQLYSFLCGMLGFMQVGIDAAKLAGGRRMKPRG